MNETPNIEIPNIEIPNIKIPNIEYNENSFAEIQEVTTVNNKKIYKINLYGCLNYISVDEYVVYISIKNADTIHIFNLKDDGFFPDDLKKQIKDNINNIKTLVLSSPKRVVRYIHRLITDKIDNLKAVYYYTCSKVINLDAAKEYVNILNEELNRTCPNFRINLDYIFNLPAHSIINTYDNLLSGGESALLLCLFHNNQCVSSLTLRIGTNISMDSKTNPIYEGRKFNKLLRAVLIIIAKLIDKNIHYVLSDAINPISAYLMINSFNATATNENNEKITKSKFEDIETEFKTSKFLFLEVQLTDENIQKARQVFDKTVANINCSEPETNTVSDTIGGNKQRKRKRTKKKIQNKKRIIKNKKRKTKRQ